MYLKSNMMFELTAFQLPTHFAAKIAIGVQVLEKTCQAEAVLAGFKKLSRKNGRELKAQGCGR
jgi:hypothetical protein